MYLEGEPVVLDEQPRETVEHVGVPGRDERVGVLLDAPRELDRRQLLARAGEGDLVLVGVEAHAPDRLAEPRVGVALVEDAEGHPRRERLVLVRDERPVRDEVDLHVLAERLRRRTCARRRCRARAARRSTPRRAAAREVHQLAHVVRRVQVEVGAEALRRAVLGRLAADLERDRRVVAQDVADAVGVLVLLPELAVEVVDAPRLRHPERRRVRALLGGAVEVDLVLGHEVAQLPLRRLQLPLAVARLHLARGITRTRRDGRWSGIVQSVAAPAAPVPSEPAIVVDGWIMTAALATIVRIVSGTSTSYTSLM